MDSIRWIFVVLSMILGLGVTRLLTGLVAVFRSRRRAEIDWIPLAWAGCIFLTQLQYWWSMNQLPEVGRLASFEVFVALVVFTLLLFLAAALLLPPEEMKTGDSLRGFFEGEGRFALAALGVYFVLTIGVNILLFDAALLRPWLALDLLMVAAPLVVFASRSRRVQVAATALAVPLYLADLVLVSDDRLFRFIG